MHGGGRRACAHNWVSEVRLAKPGGMVPLMGLTASSLREEQRQGRSVGGPA
jgi:hypothetical protein